LCEKTMERNLVLYLDHTQAHIIDRIKEEHPEWVEADGVCAPCAEYYTRQLSGELETANIGPGERRKRSAGAACFCPTRGQDRHGQGRDRMGDDPGRQLHDGV
jgi:hypothetical protein